MPWSRVNTEYSIQQVRYTPSTASTEYSIHWVLHTPCTASFQDRLLSRSQPVFSSLGNEVPSILYIATILSTRMNRVTASVAPPTWTTTSRCSSNLARSWCISKLVWSQPPSVSPNPLDYGLQVHTIMASKCISKFAQSHAPTLHDHGLGVHL